MRGTLGHLYTRLQNDGNDRGARSRFSKPNIQSSLQRAEQFYDNSRSVPTRTFEVKFTLHRVWLKWGLAVSPMHQITSGVSSHESPSKYHGSASAGAVIGVVNPIAAHSGGQPSQPHRGKIILDMRISDHQCIFHLCGPWIRCNNWEWYVFETSKVSHQRCIQRISIKARVYLSHCRSTSGWGGGGGGGGRAPPHLVIGQIPRLPLKCQPHGL